jgi:hypothetical protein
MSQDDWNDGFITGVVSTISTSGSTGGGGEPGYIILDIWNFEELYAEEVYLTPL